MENFDKRPKFHLNEGSLATAEPFSVLSDWGISETSLESSIPKEKTVQSSAIKTVITDKVMQGIMNKNQETLNLDAEDRTTKSTLSIVNEKLNATSFTPLNKMTILDTPPSQLKIFENKAQTSEKELISFIQKLMEQAKKEQEQKVTDTNSLPSPKPQVVPVRLKPLLGLNELDKTKVEHSEGETEFSKGDSESVSNLDYNHVWDSATTRSTTSRRITNKPTAMTESTTTTPITKSTTTVKPDIKDAFSPIPIETFPKINLEDFINQSGLNENPVKTKEVKKRVSDAPILPFRTTLRTTTTTTTTQKPTTTTDGSPSGVITRLLSEAAAPIAGLSAATLAYSAAAMLPVWLPLALGGRKKRSEPLDLIYYQVSQGLDKVDSVDS